MSQSNDTTPGSPKTSKLKQYQNSQKVDSAFDVADGFGSAFFYVLLALIALPIFVGAIALFTLGKIWLGLAALVVLVLVVGVVAAIKWGTDWAFDRAGESLDEKLLDKPKKTG